MQMKSRGFPVLFEQPRMPRDLSLGCSLDLPGESDADPGPLALQQPLDRDAVESEPLRKALNRLACFIQMAPQQPASA